MPRHTKSLDRHKAKGVVPQHGSIGQRDARPPWLGERLTVVPPTLQKALLVEFAQLFDELAEIAGWRFSLYMRTTDLPLGW